MNVPALPAPDPARWPLRGAIRLGLAALLALVLGLGGWAVLARLSGAVIAPGRVEVESHRQLLQHPDGGVVAEVLVREGETVAAGQILLRLDGALLHGELALLEGQLFDNQARRARLAAQRRGSDHLEFPEALVTAAAADPALAEVMAGQSRLFAARRAALDQARAQLAGQQAQITARLTGIAAQVSALATQRTLIGRELADTRALFDKGLAQAPRLLALEREAARLDGQLAELAAARMEAEARRSELAIQHRRQIAARREEAETDLAALAAQALDLTGRRRSLAARIARLDLRAPSAGIVHQLTVTTPGAVLRGAEPILALVPQDRPLLVVAHIDPHDIDRAGIGQPASLRFSAFSGTGMPEIAGRLTHIAPDAVSDPASGASYYRAEIAIPPEERDKLGGLTLIPGMPVEAFIQTGAQSPLRYLLKPFADHLSRAMREG